MNQKYILKHNEDIEKLVNKKSSVGNKFYAIYFDESENDTKVAISISKKCGSSPMRNYEKRVVREIIRTCELERLKGFKCLFVIKKEALNLSYDAKKLEIDRLISKLIEKNNERKEKR